MEQMIKYKKYFLHTMVFSLIIGALVAVISVLAGSFSDTSARVIGSLVSLVTHSFISFYIIPEADNSGMLSKLRAVSDVLFFLLIASLATSILAILQVLDGEITAKFYLCYAVVGITTLQIDSVKLLENKTKALKASFNVVVISAITLACLLLVMIFAEPESDFFYRLVGAVGIIDGSATVVMAVLYKLYLQKNPEENVLEFSDGKRGSIILRVVGLLIGAYILLNILAFLFFSLSSFR